jgi:hypothetical protein
MKDSLRKAAGVRIVTKVNPKNVFRTEANRQKLKAVFQLIPREKTKIRSITIDDLCERMTWNMRFDSLFFEKYLMEYSYAFPESALASHWKAYRENLMLNLGKDANLYMVDVPKKYDQETFSEIYRKVEENGNA